jgi:hypothetical protein
MNRRRVLAVVSTIAALSGGGAVVVSVAGADSAGENGRQTAAAMPKPADRYSVFGALGKRPTNPAVMGRVASLAPKAIAADAASTRALASTHAARVLAIAGNDAVCLHVEQASNGSQRPAWANVSCGKLSDPLTANSPMSSTTFAGDGVWQFSALVPDGITTVEVETASGEHKVLPVRTNAVATDLSSEPLHLSWTATDGSRHTQEAWSNR